MNESPNDIDELVKLSAGLGRAISDPSTPVHEIASASRLLESTNDRINALRFAKAAADAEAAKRAAEPPKNLGEAAVRSYLAAAEAAKNAPRNGLGLRGGLDRPPVMFQRPAAPTPVDPPPPEGGWRNMGEAATARFAAKQAAGPAQPIGLRPRRS